MNTKTTTGEPSSQNEVVCFGEVLWDILPTGLLPGGAPTNVAYHLKKLGTNPALISKIGTDNHGENLVNILSNHGIETEYLQVDFQYPTGLVYVNVSDRQEVTYDIVHPSSWDFIEWNDEFTDLLTKAKFFVYGSLTSRSKTSSKTLCQLLELAETNVLDINIRKPHYNQRNLEYLLQKADMLKMNETELALVSSWFRKAESLEEQIKIVQDAFNIQTVIVTLGADGAMVNDNGTVYRNKGFKVQVADTIGSGDSFLAGFIHQLLNGASPKDALDFASGVGAFVATRSGGCPEYSIEQVNELINAQLVIHI